MLISKILLFGGALIREWALIRSFTVTKFSANRKPDLFLA